MGISKRKQLSYPTWPVLTSFDMWPWRPHTYGVGELTKTYARLRILNKSLKLTILGVKSDPEQLIFGVKIFKNIIFDIFKIKKNQEIFFNQPAGQFWNRWTISDSGKKKKLIFVNYCGFHNVKSKGFSEVVARTVSIINISTKLMELSRMSPSNATPLTSNPNFYHNEIKF